MNWQHHVTLGVFLAARRRTAACRRNGGLRRQAPAGRRDPAPGGPETGWLAFSGLLLAGLVVGQAAADSRDVQVRFDGQQVEFSLDVVLQAPAAELDRVIHDYDRMSRVFPLVVSSGVLVDHGDGLRRVRADMEGCVLVFCRRLRHVLDIRQPAEGWSRAVSVAQASDVRAGYFFWRTHALGADRTRFRFSGWVEPDVWIPPVIGPLAVRRMVHRSLVDALSRLEQAARERAYGEPHPGDAQRPHPETLNLEP
jgi:hypothetical protein